MFFFCWVGGWVECVGFSFLGLGYNGIAWVSFLVEGSQVEF